MSQPTTTYERIRLGLQEHYQAFVDGSTNAAFCLVSTSELSLEAQNALFKSAQALGYSVHDITLVVLHPNEQQTLLGKDVFELIEGLDPLCMVICDQQSCQTLSEAFRVKLPTNDIFYLLGKPCCCFNQFEDMLDNQNHKQQAWACLKLLPPLKRR